MVVLLALEFSHGTPGVWSDLLLPAITATARLPVLSRCMMQFRIAFGSTLPKSQQLELARFESCRPAPSLRAASRAELDFV